jgi:SAM-dependent methyltransferase
MAEWWQTYFDEDYFQVYSFPEERTQREVDFVLNVLKLEPGSRVLDLACGHGRHTIEMAKRSLRVTGQDLSEVFIERARRDAAEAPVEVEFRVGDMREIPFTNEFDAAINLFTAFGYFAEESENERVFAAVASALRPGGQWLVDLINPFMLASGFRSRDWSSREDSGTLLLEERDWDHTAGRIRTKRILIREGGRREDEFSIRLYTLPELRLMGERAGMETLAAYGSYDGSPYSHTSRRLIFHARKSETPA